MGAWLIAAPFWRHWPTRTRPKGWSFCCSFAELGYSFMATSGTADLLESAGIPVQRLFKIGEGHPDVLDAIKEGKVDLLLNTPTRGKIPERNGFQMRRAAVEFRVPCITSLDTAAAMLRVLQERKAGRALQPYSLQEYLQRFQSVGKYRLRHGLMV